MNDRVEYDPFSDQDARRYASWQADFFREQLNLYNAYLEWLSALPAPERIESNGCWMFFWLKKYPWESKLEWCLRVVSRLALIGLGEFLILLIILLLVWGP